MWSRRSYIVENFEDALPPPPGGGTPVLTADMLQQFKDKVIAEINRITNMPSMSQRKDILKGLLLAIYDNIELFDYNVDIADNGFTYQTVGNFIGSDFSLIGDSTFTLFYSVSPRILQLFLDKVNAELTRIGTNPSMSIRIELMNQLMTKTIEKNNELTSNRSADISAGRSGFNSAVLGYILAADTNLEEIPNGWFLFNFSELNPTLPNVLTDEMLYLVLRKLAQESERLEQSQTPVSQEKNAAIANVFERIAGFTAQISDNETTLANLATFGMTYQNLTNFINNVNLATAESPANLFPGFEQLALSSSPAPAPYGSPAPAPYGSPAPAPYGSPAPAPLVYIQTGSTPGTTSTGASGTLTIGMLQQIVANVGAEMGRIASLVNGQPAMAAKFNTLISLQAAVQGYIDQITANQISITDVPIRAADAQAFLAGNLSQSNAVPTLLTPTSTTTVPNTGAGAPSQARGSSGGADIQSIFAQIQDMKWRMEINYDPTFNQQKELLDRLEGLERRIVTYISSGMAIPPDVRMLLIRELNLISNIIVQSAAADAGAGATGKVPLSRAPPTRSSRTPTGAVGAASTTDPTRVHSNWAATGSGAMYNEDARIRPGFIMNDYQIQHRGSAAAFNSGVAGGLDFKQRSKDLCRQIRSAGLGDPASFGCISNPNEVSDTYSWRGNFKMVCDRLGDTWGHWYPEMMGCLPNK